MQPDSAEAAHDGALSRAAAACERAVSELLAAQVPTEALAEYVPPRRVMLITRAATMRPLGKVWRIGSLLLGTDASLYAVGRATRAAERGRPGYQSLSREERRELAAAALRGGYAAGEAVNYDAEPILLSPDTPETLRALANATGPVGYAAGELRVRWRAGAQLDGAPTLASFLAERVTLLIDPPFAS